MKFSIRDLLFVTVIVAMTVGWWLERRQRVGLESRLVTAESRLVEAEVVHEAWRTLVHLVKVEGYLVRTNVSTAVPPGQVGQPQKCVVEIEWKPNTVFIQASGQH